MVQPVTINDPYYTLLESNQFLHPNIYHWTQSVTKRHSKVPIFAFYLILLYIRAELIKRPIQPTSQAHISHSMLTEIRIFWYRGGTHLKKLHQNVFQKQSRNKIRHLSIDEHHGSYSSDGSPRKHHVDFFRQVFIPNQQPHKE